MSTLDLEILGLLFLLSGGAKSLCKLCYTIAAADSAALINSSDGALSVGTIFIL